MNDYKNNPEQTLIQDITRFYHDPLGFVRYAFPWGESELAKENMKQWQIEVLDQIGQKLRRNECNASDAIRLAIASGHGIGKSALVAWVILWAISTFEDTRGVVTANTENQLRTKTWPELAKWLRLCICGHWFKYTATALFSVDPKHEKTWRFDMAPWSVNNTEAFAGLHNAGRRIVMIYDEASAIPDIIWEVSEGALTDEDTEMLWLACGNPTRNNGRFRECFGRLRHRWQHWQIDSRQVEKTNKVQINQWVEDYGEDSDFVRVRVRGLFPRSSDMQLIPTEWVRVAMARAPFYTYDDPLILGIDVARGGADNNVIVARRGDDAKTISALTIPGTETRDSMRLVARIVTHVADLKPDAVFIDATGVGGPVADRLRQLGVNAIDINFAGKADNERRYANIRAQMWWKLREAIKNTLTLPDHNTLEQELTTPEYSLDSKDRILLESKETMKKRGLASPDYADALALTYAMPVLKLGIKTCKTSYLRKHDTLKDL